MTEQIKTTPMSDADIKKYLPDTKIITYSDLKDYKTLDQLLPNVNDCVIILYQTSPNYGHWTGLLKYVDNKNTPIIEYFDSYGHKIDEPLTWVSKKELQKMGIYEPYLMNLIKKDDKHVVISNATPLQSSNPDISTCGRYVTGRLIHFIGNHSTLKTFLKTIKDDKQKMGGNYDDTISRIINKYH